MNKKINYLVLIPSWGTVIILIFLFIKSIRKEINKKKFNALFFRCGILSLLSKLVVILLLLFINSLIDITRFIDNYGILVEFVIGGYLMNIFTFTLINKKWNDIKNEE